MLPRLKMRGTIWACFRAMLQRAMMQDFVVIFSRDRTRYSPCIQWCTKSTILLL